jgi:hypothetical protein
VNPKGLTELSGDGAWTWFTNPRALRDSEYGKTYVGYITSEAPDGTGGDAAILSYDESDGSITRTTLKSNWKDDDHNVPGLVVRPDGHVIAFYSHHNDAPIYYRISSSPGDISSFDAEQTVSPSTQHTYMNPRYIGSDLYLFYRNESANGDANLAYIKSTDDGATWATEQELIEEDGNGYGEYFQISKAVNGRIDIALTRATGNRDGPKNDIRHVYFDGDTVYASDRTALGSESGGTLPISHATATVVYDSSISGNHSAWCWGCTHNDGNPQIVYAELRDIDDHHYRYARWDGSQWDDTHLTEGGSHITSGLYRELFYSPGLFLDPERDGVVYMAVGDHTASQIQRWDTDDGGQTWHYQQISAPSKQNVRPVVPYNRSDDLPVVWLQGQYDYFEDGCYETGIVGGAEPVNHPGSQPTRSGGGLGYMSSGTATVPSGSVTTLPIDDTVVDMRREHDPSGDRFDVIKSGWYLITASIGWDSVSAGGEFGGKIVTSRRTQQLARSDVSAGSSPVCTGSMIQKFTTGDGIQLKAWQNSGSDQTVLNGFDLTNLKIVQLSP